MVPNCWVTLYLCIRMFRVYHSLLYRTGTEMPLTTENMANITQPLGLGCWCSVLLKHVTVDAKWTGLCFQTLQCDPVSGLIQGQRLLVKVIKANGLQNNGSYTCTSYYYYFVPVSLLAIDKLTLLLLLLLYYYSVITELLILITDVTITQ